MSTIKAWLLPLARTFLAVFLLTFVGSLAKLDFEGADLGTVSVIGSIALGALGTAANALVLAVQRLLPGVPDPKPPVA